MPLVKITRSRQVSIPKALFEKLELQQGDYLEITSNGEELVLRPQSVVDRQRQKAKIALGELLEAIWERNKDLNPDEVQSVIAETIQQVKAEKKHTKSTHQGQ